MSSDERGKRRSGSTLVVDDVNEDNDTNDTKDNKAKKNCTHHPTAKRRTVPVASKSTTSVVPQVLNNLEDDAIENYLHFSPGTKELSYSPSSSSSSSSRANLEGTAPCHQSMGDSDDKRQERQPGSSTDVGFSAFAAGKGAVRNNDGTATNNNNNNDPKVASAVGDSDHCTSQDYYFDSYAHHAIHEEMLKDQVRTQTYQMAITQNAHLFRDKIVLDVGCGTAILSLFCAVAGAKHVYAVDCSGILQQARKIVAANGYADKITLIQGRIEDIQLPVDKVDIIVSEWMGYFLLYESMLDTVIYARDKWLVPGGKIFPDKAILYVSAMEDESVRRERIDFWDDVYGFDMSPIKEIALREPVVDVVDPKSLVTDAVPILHLDILTCTKEDLSFTSDFKLQARRNDYIHGLVAYFECAFTQIHKPIGFSTAPFCRYTHWKQTVFYVPETITVCAGETLAGHVSCNPNPRNRRDLDISIRYLFRGKHSTVNTTVQYRLR